MKYLNDTGLSRVWSKIKDYLSGNYVTTSDSRLSDSRTPISHASTATTYGVGTTSNYGHCKTINNLTTSSHKNGNALSAYQGYLLNQNKASTSYVDSACVNYLILFGLDTKAYSSSTSYAVGDMCVYENRLYECIKAGTGYVPTNTTYWEEVPILVED